MSTLDRPAAPVIGRSHDDTLWEALGRALPVGLFRTDAAGACTYVNPRWCELTGLTLKEALGNGWERALHPDDRLRIAAAWAQSAATNQNFAEEYRFLRPDGSVVWIFGQAVSQLDPDGSVAGYIGSITDVTDQRQDLDRLRQSEAHLSALVDQTIAGIAETDLTGRFLFVNDRYCEITGFPRAELLSGMHMQEITHADDLPRNLELFRQLGEDGVPFIIEKRYVRQDGSVVWVNNSVSAVKDVGGNVLSAVAVVIDVTERKQAEEQLRESTGQLRALTNLVPGIFWTAPPDGEADYASEQWYEFTGAPVDAPVGETFLAALHPDDVERVLTARTHAHRTGTAYELELRIRSALGIYHWFLVNGIPSRDESGTIRKWFGISTDITERKRRELNAKFLAELGEDLSRLSNADDMMRLFGEKVCIFLGGSACRFTEYDLARQAARVIQEWRADDRPSLVGEYQFSDFITPDAVAQLAAGGQIAIDNVAADGRTAAVADRFEALGIGAVVTTPYLSDGRLRATVTVQHPAARDWRSEELDLLRDLTGSVWPRIERARIDDALRLSEASFRWLADAMPQFVWVGQADGSVSYLNQQWYEFSGLTLEQTNDLEQLALLFHPDDREEVFSKWSAALADSTPLEVEARMRGVDQSYRWFLIRSRPVSDERNQIRRWFGTSTDITAFKETEDRLRQSERRLQLLADAMPQVVWVADSQGDVRYYNDRISGFDLRQSRGGAFDWRPMIHADDLRSTVTAWVKAVRDGSSYAHEHRIRMADGTYRWHLTRAVPVRDEYGEVESWYGTATDIHELKQAEHELDQRRREFESLVEHSPDIVARFDRDLRYLYVNPAIERVTGISPVQFIGKTNAELGLPAAMVALWETHGQDALSSGRVQHFEFAYLARDGTRYFRTRLVPEASNEGQIRTLLSVADDVTDRVRAERERQTLLDALAHDLRGPLTVMKAHAQLLHRQITQGRAPDSETLAERVAGFESLATRMGDLVNELEDHSLLAESEPVELKFEPTDLAALVRGCIDELRQTSASHEIRLKAAKVAGEWDPRRLRRVVANLLNNAIKYSPGGGAIRVRLTRANDEAVLQIRDEGIGIPESDLPHIFDFGSRAGNVGPISGSGIGLAGARRIVEQHGGSIAVATEEGKGSTFTVRLPLTPRTRQAGG